MTYVPYPYKKYSDLSLSLAYRDWFRAPTGRYFGGILYAVSIVEEAGPVKTLCQQVGTIPYFYVAGRGFFYCNFLLKWIGRCGFITLPPLSSDLSPFYLSL